MWSVAEDLKHGGKLYLTMKKYICFVNKQIDVH